MKPKARKIICLFFLFGSLFLKAQFNTLLPVAPKKSETKDMIENHQTERNREEELEAMYKLGVEERYIEILNAIIDEEKLFISKKEENFLIDAINKSKDLEETDFYVFYVNYISKKEYENKKVLVGYNGVDGKEVTMSKLKEDINKLRDDRSTFK